MTGRKLDEFSYCIFIYLSLSSFMKMIFGIVGVPLLQLINWSKISEQKGRVIKLKVYVLGIGKANKLTKAV